MKPDPEYTDAWLDKLDAIAAGESVPSAQDDELLDVAARLTKELAPLREMDRTAELHRQHLSFQLRARQTVGADTLRPAPMYRPAKHRPRLSVLAAALLLIVLAVGMMSRGELGALWGNVMQLWHTSTSLDQVKGIDIASLERPHAGLKPLPLLPAVLPNDTEASAYGVITDSANPNVLNTFVADYQIAGQQVWLYEQPSDIPFSSSTARTVLIGTLEGQWFQDDVGNNALQWYQHNMVCQITSRLPVNRLVALASTFQPIRSWDLLI